MKKEKKLNLFLLCFPFIDFVTSIATWESLPSIGLIIKGLFFLFAIYYILKNREEKKIKFLFLLLSLYILFTICYWYFKDTSVIKGEIIHLVKIYYLPILILFFKTSKEKIERKTIFILLLQYLLFYLVPYPFGLGHNIKEIYPNKDLYLSYFYIGNELSNIFVLLLPTSFFYLLKEQKRFLLPVSILTICMLLLLGTKTMYLSILIILAYFLFYYRKTISKNIKKHFKKITLITLLVLTFLIFWIPKSNLYQNIKTSLEYYEVDSIKELMTFENIDNIIYSSRLSFLQNVHHHYIELTEFEKIIGLGRTKINEIKDIEIDIFDIFYSVGILGTIVYFIFFYQVLKAKKNASLTKFTFSLLIIISCFTGHVLISPMTTTYLASLFGMEDSNEKLDKKSIKKTTHSLNVE